MKKIALILALLLIPVSAGAFRRPIKRRRQQAALTCDLSLSSDTCFHTTRAASDIWVNNGANAATKISAANTAVFEDKGDGRGGGFWTFGPYTNRTAGAAFNFAVGAGANLPDSAGWAQNNFVSFAKDDSGHAHYGWLQGGITSVASPWAGFGNAYHFDGVMGSVVTVGGTYTRIASPFGLEVRGKRDRSGIPEEFNGRWGNGASNNFLLYFDITDHLHGIAIDAGGGANNIADAGTVAAGAQFIAALDWDGTTLRLFRDGTVVASAALAGLQASSDFVDFSLGQDTQTPTAFPFQGILDEMRLSNVSRHTANYTPATVPFSTDVNTVLLMHAEAVGAGYSTGYVAPDGTSTASSLISSGNGSPAHNVTTYLEYPYAAGGVGDSNGAYVSLWVKNNPNALAAISSAVSAQPGASGGFSILSASTPWARFDTVSIRSGPGTDAIDFFPAGASIVGNTISLDIATGGGSLIWGAQLNKQSNGAQVPIAGTSTGASTLSLDSGLLSQLTQPGNIIHLGGSFLADESNTPSAGFGTVPAPRQLGAAIDTADGVTGLSWFSDQAIQFVVNGVQLLANISQGSNALHQYGVPSDEEWEYWIDPTTNQTGFRYGYNGCMWSSGLTTSQTMHAVSALTLGSHGANTYWDRRHRSFGSLTVSPYQTDGLIVGDSLMAQLTTVHMNVCVWTLTESEARSGHNINSVATIADTIQGQDARVAAYVANSGGQCPLWFWNQVGVNNSAEGEGVMSARYQLLLNHEHSLCPSAIIFEAPITPCNGGCDWVGVVKPFNDDIATIGTHPILCPAGATCVIAPTYDTALLLGDGTNTGHLAAVYNSGDSLHWKDPGGQKIGLTVIRALLIANGVL